MSNPLATVTTLLAQNESASTLTAIWDWAIRNKPLLMVTGVTVLLAFVVSTIVARWVTRSVRDEIRRHKARRTISYMTQIVAVLIVIVTWAGKFNLQLLIGLASVGLALALQNVILSFAGWIKIVLSRPFDIGDRIQAGEHIGDVIDIGLLHTYILEVGNWVGADQSTGRVAYIPNSVVFTQTVFNYTQGFPYVWHELPVLVTFESDWRRAKMILEDLVTRQSRDMSEKVRTLIQRMKRDYPIRYSHLHPIVYTTVRDSGVLLTVRYLTEARERRQWEADLCEEILDAFAKEPTINFAYPTYRMTGGAGIAEPMTRMGIENVGDDRRDDR